MEWAQLISMKKQYDTYRIDIPDQKGPNQTLNAWTKNMYTIPSSYESPPIDRHFMPERLLDERVWLLRHAQWK